MHTLAVLTDTFPADEEEKPLLAGGAAILLRAYDTACAVAPQTSACLLLPSVQGEHVHCVGEEQQQAEWRPHLGSLVLLAPRRPGSPCEATASGTR